jgi:hypothetical protein
MVSAGPGGEVSVNVIAPPEAELREFLQRDLLPRMPGSQRITGLSVQRSECSSWYATYLVTVTLSNGPSMTLFLKDYGSYREEKSDMTGRRERERYVYKDLIAEGSLGTAQYLGSQWDNAANRFWLLLEFVHGTPLQFLAFEQWLEAAAWLATLQGWFRDRLPSVTRSPLLRHDVRFFRQTATAAVLAVGTLSAALRRRLKASLDGYSNLWERMERQPLTLVHGAYLPSQIIVDIESVDNRLCPVDWELAGLGSPCYDLAFLVYGFGQAQLRLLLEAYAEEAGRQALEVPALSELERLTSAYCIHKTLMALGHSAERGYSEDAVCKYLDILESLVSPQS